MARAGPPVEAARAWDERRAGCPRGPADRGRARALIVLDASAAIDLVLDGGRALAIAEDLAREGPTLMPAHFEADSYAGLRHMVNAGRLHRAAVPVALTRIAELRGQRIPLAPMVTAAYGLYDNIGAHDAFYVVLAAFRRATLLTSDGPLARAAAQFGITVRFRPSELIG